MTSVPAPGPVIATSWSGAVTEIRIGDGSRRNALPGRAWAQLARQVRELGDDSSLRVLVIRGHGGTFCAGSNMTDWVDADSGYVEESFAHMEAAFTAIEECPVPVIAEIRGVAAGAGCQLALACDLRFMADGARIGMPIARLGILASPAFAARMVALAGPAAARELLYTGRLVDARTAVALGLADDSVPEEHLAARTSNLAAAVAEQPPAAIRAAKLAVAAALAPQREAAAANPRPAVARSDFDRAIAAFLGQRSAAAAAPPAAPP
ncbi:enoyl-CoA hydratase/isomerase family protein [Streptomyces decoyicus]|uniref:enoyl-CoA hydratase/isomerase family protein n=1 Tax=Streptomyces decoyicus TaxID=249567 RepID=UPI002E16FD3C|nr:enoyl-CoA hydratase/isomerase family protein [Streptomyces decoyicus]